MTRRGEKRLLWILLWTALAFSAARREHSPSKRESPKRATDTFTVLAGSDLKDIQSRLKDNIRQATGIDLVFTYSGALDAVNRLAAGEKFDALWVSQGKYAVMNDATKGRILAQEKTMLSPVILGLKTSKARELGWDTQEPTWKDIDDAAKAGKFTFGMANPSSSNTGLTATIGLAAALAQNSDALTEADLTNPRITDFFRAQSLTSGSSEWLAEAYERDQSKVDGIINYESVLLSLNASGKLSEPLTLIYPKEGIITAGYPLMLLSAAKRTDYEKLVAYLRSKDFQARMSALTLRRPVNPDAIMASAIPRRTLIELPFPSQPALITGLVNRFLPDASGAGASRYVLDLSSFMDARRIASLKQAVLTLTSASTHEVGIITFSSYPAPTAFFSMGLDPIQNAQARAAVAQFIQPLHASGASAIYDSIRQALIELAAERSAAHETRPCTVVLMTDGESNSGLTASEFDDWYQSRNNVRGIPVFPILFGEGNTTELNRLADLTGGRLFDSRSTPLAQIFKEIRGYQ